MPVARDGDPCTIVRVRVRALSALSTVALAGAPWWTCNGLWHDDRPVVVPDAEAPRPPTPAPLPNVPTVPGRTGAANDHISPPPRGAAPRPSLSTTEPREEITPPSLTPAPPPAPKRAQLADGVVVHALGASQPDFLRCYTRAQKVDPLLADVKVTLHVEVDGEGKITHVTQDAPTPAFGACLAVVARGLAFPAPHRLAQADLPLFFQP
jgi:hypothetical protein